MTSTIEERLRVYVHARAAGSLVYAAWRCLAIMCVLLSASRAGASIVGGQGAIGPDIRIISGLPIVAEDEFGRFMACLPFENPALQDPLSKLAQEAVDRIGAECVLGLGVRSISVCRSLEVDGEELTAFAMGRSGEVYMRIRPALTMAQWTWLIAHETWHVRDQQAAGVSLAEPGWQSLMLHPWHRDAPTGRFEHITKYAERNNWEDRAETFSAFIAIPWILHPKSAMDALLCEKVQLIAEDARSVCPSIAARVAIDPVEDETVSVPDALGEGEPGVASDVDARPAD